MPVDSVLLDHERVSVEIPVRQSLITGSMRPLSGDLIVTITQHKDFEQGPYFS